MAYIENPKTKGSGIICAIPQSGTCPMQCPDCFFQSGRSYLEPLKDNLPNMPRLDEADGRIVRVNDGNDSNNQRELVMNACRNYEDVFYNTSMIHDLEGYEAPVVLTVNPGKMTDTKVHLADPCPPNLMYVRVRTNTWNLLLVDQTVEHYTKRSVPVVLTFMAYYNEEIHIGKESDYSYRQRTMNSYWVLTQEACDEIMKRYKDNAWVYTCGKNMNTFSCSRCGNCLREYLVTKERMRTKQ